MKLKFISLLAVLAAILFVAIPTASAQSNTDLTISPSVIDLNANPGDIIHQTFRIRNNLDKSINYSIILKKLSANLSSDFPVPQDVTASDVFANWVKIDPSSFVAKPAEWEDISFTINIPTTAAYGYYYAFAIVPSDSANLKGPGNVLRGETLIPILLNVNAPGAKMQGQIISFAPRDFVSEYLPVDFNVVFQNTGNVAIRPRGNIFIRGQNNNDLANLEVNVSMLTILPDGKRTFTSAPWDDGFLVNEPVMEDGQLKYEHNEPVMQLTANWNKLTSLRIGRYTADLVMVYNDGKRDVALNATTTFWIFPWKFLLGVFVALIIIVFLVQWVLKSYIRSQVKKYQK